MELPLEIYISTSMVSPAGVTGNRCHFVLLDKDESSPTADLSNIGRPNGPAYSTGELLNTPSLHDHAFNKFAISRDSRPAVT